MLQKTKSNKIISKQNTRQHSAGETEIAPPAELPPAAVTQYQRTLHDSMALRKVHGNKTQQFQITASFTPSKTPERNPQIDVCLLGSTVSLKGTPTGTARLGNGLNWK